MNKEIRKAIKALLNKKATISYRSITYTDDGRYESLMHGDLWSKIAFDILERHVHEKFTISDPEDKSPTTYELRFIQLAFSCNSFCFHATTEPFYFKKNRDTRRFVQLYYENNVKFLEMK